MIDIPARGSFNLTKFTSNSKEVLKAVPSNQLSNQGLKLDLDDAPIKRALGVLWYVGDDTLGFKIKHLDRPETKRGILSTVCSLFDPLGFAAPVALAARCLVQDLWKAYVGRDKPLREEFLLKWRSSKTSYLPCRSCASHDPISSKIGTHKTASCSCMSFPMHQRLGIVYHPVCELST